MEKIPDFERLVRIYAQEYLESGTSQGVKKSWDTRKGGGGGKDMGDSGRVQTPHDQPGKGYRGKAEPIGMGKLGKQGVTTEPIQGEKVWVGGDVDVGAFGSTGFTHKSGHFEPGKTIPAGTPVRVMSNGDRHTITDLKGRILAHHSGAQAPVKH